MHCALKSSCLRKTTQSPLKQRQERAGKALSDQGSRSDKQQPGLGQSRDGIPTFLDMQSPDVPTPGGSPWGQPDALQLSCSARWVHGKWQHKWPLLSSPRFPFPQDPWLPLYQTGWTQGFSGCSCWDKGSSWRLVFTRWMILSQLFTVFVSDMSYWERYLSVR